MTLFLGSSFDHVAKLHTLRHIFLQGHVCVHLPSMLPLPDHPMPVHVKGVVTSATTKP